MMRPSILTLLFSLAAVRLVAADKTALLAIKAAFEKAQVPEDLNINFNPSVPLIVAFSPNTTLYPGVQLPRLETQTPPVYSFPVIDRTPAYKGPFVIAAVDPDAPTPQNPTYAQIRHFLGGNFVFTQGGLLKNLTPAISEYRGPNPPAGSDRHRYVFLLYKQPAGFNNQTYVTPTTSIAQFNISDFATKVGLGDPVAGNFMYVAPTATPTPTPIPTPTSSPSADDLD